MKIKHIFHTLELACNSGKISKLTHGYQCHLTDVRFAGFGDDDGLDSGDGASFVEISRKQSFHFCGLFLDGHTFQTYDL